jgi:hypothetical protein
MDTAGCQLLIALVMQASSNPVSFVMETEEIGHTGIFISLPDILFLFDPNRTSTLKVFLFSSTDPPCLPDIPLSISLYPLLTSKPEGLIH